MKLKLTLLLFFFAFVTQAQNWKVLDQSDTLFYGLPETHFTKYIGSTYPVKVAEFALNPDSVIDNDSVELVRLRKYWGPCDDSVSRNVKFGAVHFMGHSYEIHKNEWRFNHDSFHLTIRPNHPINQKWTFDPRFKDSMWVAKRFVGKVLNSVDSIVQLVSDHGDTIEFSKQFGLYYFKTTRFARSHYRLLGSQKQKEGIYIPPFNEFHKYAENHWYCQASGYSSSSINRVEDSEDHHVILKVEDNADSVVLYQRSYRYTDVNKLFSGPNTGNTTRRKLYTSQVLYKNRYEVISSPFNDSVDSQSLGSAGGAYLKRFAAIDTFGDHVFLRIHTVTNNPPSECLPTHLDNDASHQLNYSILKNLGAFSKINHFEYSGYADYCPLQPMSSFSLDTTYYYHVGMEDSKLQNIRVYPNPGNGLFWIDAPDDLSGSVTIRDPQGKIVFRGDLDTESPSDLRHLSRGMYFLEVRGALGGSYLERIIIQ